MHPSRAVLTAGLLASALALGDRQRPLTPVGYRAALGTAGNTIATPSSRDSIGARLRAGGWHAAGSHLGLLSIGGLPPVPGSLAVSGASLQALVRNPLADPYLLGLSGGAGLGAVIAIAVGATGPWTVPIAAFIGTIGAVILVYRLGLAAGGRVDTRALLLAGVVVSGFAGAIMTAIIVLSPAEQLRDAFLWLLGGLGRASWRSVTVLAAFSVLPLLALARLARDLDLLSLGEEAAGLFLGKDVELTVDDVGEAAAKHQTSSS